MNIEERINEAAQAAILRHIAAGAWIEANWSDRFRVPKGFLDECWALVDQEAMKRKFAERIESELVDRIVNHIAAELATDIKQILSVKERREAIREIARQHVLSLGAPR